MSGRLYVVGTPIGNLSPDKNQNILVRKIDKHWEIILVLHLYPLICKNLYEY